MSRTQNLPNTSTAKYWIGRSKLLRAIRHELAYPNFVRRVQFGAHGTAAPGTASEYEGGSDVAPGFEDRGFRPRLLGPLALNNHRWELQTLLEECLGALYKADPSMQHSLALQQKALLERARDVSVSAASTAHEVRENVSLLMTSPTSGTTAHLSTSSEIKGHARPSRQIRLRYRLFLPMSGGMNHCWCPKRSEEGGVQSRLPSISSSA
jgi:hypothetical protein